MFFSFEFAHIFLIKFVLICFYSTFQLLYTFEMKQEKGGDSGSEQTKWDLQLSSNRQMGHGEIRAITRVDKFLVSFFTL